MTEVIDRWRGIAIAIALLALVVIVAGTFYGGLGPDRLPGLPYAGRVTELGLPILRVSSELLACIVAGLFLGAVILLRSDNGQLTSTARGILAKTSGFALLWTVCIFLQLVFSYSEFAPVPIQDAFSISQIGAFVEAVPQAKALFIQGCLASILCALAIRLKSSKEAGAGLLITLIAVLPPPLTGHAAGLGGHSLATSTLSLHVISATVWAGGVCFLFFASRALNGPQLRYAVERFSPIAAWCFAAVFLSGVANALLRVDSWNVLFSTNYGFMIIVKFVAAIVLGYIGWRHRQETMPKLVDDNRGAFRRFIAVELAIMAATFSVAVSLARSSPDNSAPLSIDPTELTLGFKLPDATSVSNVLTGVELDGFAIIAAVFAIALFVVGIRRSGGLAVRGHKLRLALWIIGWLIITFVTSGGVGLYSHILFSYHAIQQLILVFVAPIFLVLAQPFELVRNFKRNDDDEAGPWDWLADVGDKMPAYQPLVLAVAVVVVALTNWVLYFSPLFEGAMKNHFGHVLMEAFFVLSGTVFLSSLRSALHKMQLAPLVLASALVSVSAIAFAFALRSYGREIASGYYSLMNRDWGSSVIVDQQQSWPIFAFAFVCIGLFIALAATINGLAAADKAAAEGRNRTESRL